MEALDVWDNTAILTAVKMMNAIRTPLSWVPLLETQMQEWEAMIAGAAASAGVDITLRMRPSKDVVEDAEEKGA